MFTKHVCVCVLAAGAANAFFALPPVPTARSVTRSTALRMDAGSEASKAGDFAKSAGHHIKEAGKDAVSNNSSSGKGEASKAGDQAKNAAQHLKEAGKDAVSSNSPGSTSGAASEIRGSTAHAEGSTKGASTGVTADSKETVWEAPVEKVRIHERVEEVDKTRIEEQRVKTEVKQVVQPIKDEKRREEEVRSVDHGTEVREHGNAGLDSKTEAELKRRRDELAQDAGTVRDKEVKQTSLRPDVDKKEFVNVVEQVVPVIERDIYVPKKVEHEKKVVEIYNEAPEIKATEIKEAISKEEFEKRYGGKVESKSQGTPSAYTTQEEHKETKHTSSSGGNAVKSSSSSSGSAGGSAGSSAGSSAQHNTQHKTKHEPAPYSMSDVNMAHDAEQDSSEGSGKGVLGGIKEKIKNILD